MKSKIKQFLLQKVKEIQEDNLLKQKKENLSKLEIDDNIGLETQNSTWVAEMNSQEKNAE